MWARKIRKIWNWWICRGKQIWMCFKSTENVCRSSTVCLPFNQHEVISLLKTLKLFVKSGTVFFKVCKYPLMKQFHILFNVSSAIYRKSYQKAIYLTKSTKKICIRVYVTIICTYRARTPAQFCRSPTCTLPSSSGMTWSHLVCAAAPAPTNIRLFIEIHKCIKHLKYLVWCR